MLGERSRGHQNKFAVSLGSVKLHCKFHAAATYAGHRQKQLHNLLGYGEGKSDTITSAVMLDPSTWEIELIRQNRSNK